MPEGVPIPDKRATLELSDEMISKLRRVVRRLVADCVKWYEEDMPALERMSDEDLDRLVMDYLSKRDWYQRRKRCLNTDAMA